MIFVIINNLFRNVIVYVNEANFDYVIKDVYLQIKMMIKLFFSLIVFYSITIHFILYFIIHLQYFHPPYLFLS